MEMIDKKEVAINVAWSFLGKPYMWGGDDPVKGFDCSGLVIECLKSAGMLPREGDWSAQVLWEMFEKKQTAKPERGCLVFWQDQTGKAIHVELCISDELSIGASGGGSRTLTEKDAIEQNAYIKVRPLRSRASIKGFVDPFK